MIPHGGFPTLDLKKGSRTLIKITSGLSSVPTSGAFLLAQKFHIQGEPFRENSLYQGRRIIWSVYRKQPCSCDIAVSECHFERIPILPSWAGETNTAQTETQ
jgi:hypothetical protein